MPLSAADTVLCVVGVVAGAAVVACAGVWGAVAGMQHAVPTSVRIAASSSSSSSPSSSGGAFKYRVERPSTLAQVQATMRRYGKSDSRDSNNGDIDAAADAVEEDGTPRTRRWTGQDPATGEFVIVLPPGCDTTVVAPHELTAADRADLAALFKLTGAVHAVVIKLFEPDRGEPPTRPQPPVVCRLDEDTP